MQPEPSFDIWDNIREAQPKFNPVIANGIAMAHFEDVEKYIDEVFKLTSKSFPEGLEYVGFTRCTPEEEMRETKELLNKKRTIELCRSSVYMVYYHFTYKGEPLTPKPLWLPYLEQAGQYYLRGTLNTVIPVLADGGLSVSKRDIFIAFLKGKVTFKSRNQQFYRNGRAITSYVVHAQIHNSNPKTQPRWEEIRDDSVKIEHATILYLLGKYGLQGTIQKYFGNDIIRMTDDEFDEKDYPRDEWYLCEPTGNKPKTCRMLGWMIPTTRFAVRIQDWNTQIEAFIASFYYIAEHFPDRVNTFTGSTTTLWRVLLAKAIKQAHLSEGKLLEEADKHFLSVDTYLDGLLRESLRKTGVEVEDIYDLFMYLVGNFMDVILNREPGNMFGKQLSVLRYMLANVIEGINKIHFSLISSPRSKEEGTKELKPADINRAFGKNLQPDAFFKHGKAKCASATQSAGDNIMFSFTAKCISQEDATTKTKKDKSGDLNNPEKQFHPSIIEIGSILNNRKSDPTGRGDLNPYQITGKDGIVIPNPIYRDLMRDIRELTQQN